MMVMEEVAENTEFIEGKGEIVPSCFPQEETRA